MSEFTAHFTHTSSGVKRRRSLNKNDSLLIIFIVWTFWNAVLFHDDAIFINSITGIFLYGTFAVFSIFRELL